MTTERPAHAKHRPPSAAARWVACPGSAEVTPLYPNDESDASKKGDVAHNHFENAIAFGLLPDTDDPDMDLNVRGAYEWVLEQKRDYINRHKQCQVYAEKQYDIPETGEWGTADVTFVTPKTLHIADYKNGYVPVEIKINAQMMTYLLGAVAEFGERPEYHITVLQPNYNHIDGPYRTWTVSQKDFEWWQITVLGAVKSNDFNAGFWCKKTYCPHRGACLEFMTWAKTVGADAWYPSEIHALDDVQLAQALDHAEVLQGLRDELRKEAMRRIMNMDKRIDGYKIVRSRQDRDFLGDEAREEAFKLCRELGASDADLYAQKPETVAGIERFIKQKYKNYGRGVWKEAFDKLIKPSIREFSGGLTLERATDGRPTHTRGSEFGAITPPAQPAQVGQVNII